MARFDSYTNEPNIVDGDALLFWDATASAVREIDVEDLIRFAGAGGAAITVAAAEAELSVKRRSDYVCDGTNDHTTIQSALDAAGTWAGADPFGAPAAVHLSAGVFSVGGSITLSRGQVLAGAGIGATVLSVDSTFSGYVIENNDPNVDNLITIRDMFIDGQYEANVGGIRLRNWDAGTYGDPTTTFNDSVHVIDNVYVFTVGLDGILLDGSGGATQNSRGNRVRNCRLTGVNGDGIHLNTSSDNYLLANTTSTNRTGTGGHGYVVAGGSNKLVLCKSFYTDSNGFEITSSRALLVGCYAQDAGANGIHIAGVDAMLSGCTADSSNRLNTGDSGIVIDANDINVAGCKSIDRNQSANRQQYGLRYTSGDRIRVDLSTSGNVTGPEVGTWTSATDRNIQIMDDALGFLESASTPTSFS